MKVFFEGLRRSSIGRPGGGFPPPVATTGAGMKQNEDERIKWAGIPFHYRYSRCVTGPGWLIRKMREIDPWLDLKFYLPLQQWHVVRYPYGFSNGEFTKVWECVEDPARGLRGGPGPWILDALRAGDLRKRDIAKEIDDHNEGIEKSWERKVADDCLAVAAELRKPVQALYDYGEKSDYHEVY